VALLKLHRVAEFVVHLAPRVIISSLGQMLPVLELAVALEWKQLHGPEEDLAQMPDLHCPGCRGEVGLGDILLHGYVPAAIGVAQPVDRLIRAGRVRASLTCSPTIPEATIDGKQ